jgi:hypothetical protein
MWTYSTITLRSRASQNGSAWFTPSHRSSMPRLQASISLPHVLRLTHGLYQSGQPGQELEMHQRQQRPGVQHALRVVSPTSDRSDSDIWEMTASHTDPTLVSLTIVHPDTEDPNVRRRLKSRQADQLLSLTNRLLRSYRSITKDSAITELSRAGASPFRFRADPDGLILPLGKAT